MLQIELTEGDCVNGSAGCKMGEAVAGSLGPRRVGRESGFRLEACGLPTNFCSTCWAQPLPLVGKAQTLWSCLLGETYALQESEIGPSLERASVGSRDPFSHLTLPKGLRDTPSLLTVKIKIQATQEPSILHVRLVGR